MDVPVPATTPHPDVCFFVATGSESDTMTESNLESAVVTGAAAHLRLLLRVHLVALSADGGGGATPSFPFPL